MSGLDSIVEEIHRQAKAEADEILKQADEYCNSFMEQAKKETALEIEKIEKKAQADRKLYEEKTKSGAEFRQRNSLLKTRQECINKVIAQAQKTIHCFSDEKYFDFIGKILESNVSDGCGVIYFNAKDLERLPKDFGDKIKDISKSRGGSLEISSQARDIEDGFILTYGEIEENCTVKALFAANIDKLKDIANKSLFEKTN